MKQLLIIPEQAEYEECINLSKEYNLGFEYNDFFQPDLLDDEKKVENIICEYKKQELPKLTTLHGAFFDVIPFSVDKKIREIADLRIEQSIAAAKKLGAKAVIFHTNYTSFLNSESYIDNWIKINTEYWSLKLQKHKDINIYLENMFDASPYLLEKLSLNLCKYNNYGVCLDWAHAFLSDTNLEEWVKSLSSFVKHIHINDNDGVSDLHLAWGDGVIPRELFYEYYEKYMNGATVLIETSTMDNKRRSLEKLRIEGFN